MTKTEQRNMLDLHRTLNAAGFSSDEINALVRIERTLQRWGERECGTDHGCICRDDETDKPYWLDSQSGRRTPILDREASAKRRLAAIMAKHPHWLAYHQTDCRGCNLYLLRKSQRKPGASADSIYNRGVAVCYW
jgi:hypothetical protein